MLFITNKGVFMQGVEVGIEEVLMCRERRVDIQNEMIKKYNMPLISFTMNIPGPIKTNQKIKKAFDIGKKLILEKLKENNIEILEIKELDENTGNELFISVDSTDEKIKDITIAIEESSQLGRLFDMDVIDVNFEKLSRKSFRKCLICEEQAQECGRSRKHSIEELQEKVEEFKNESFILVGVAGTTTTQVSVREKMEVYDSEKIHLSNLTTEEISDNLDLFIKNIKNDKNVKGLDTKRRDVIIGGTIILKEILKYFKKDSLVVSENDNLMGAILEGVNENDRYSK